MCFSAAANFVGSGALGAVGVITLTKVRHRRELLFASLPALFAIHQFIEGFVWLGLDAAEECCPFSFSAEALRSTSFGR